MELSFVNSGQNFYASCPTFHPIPKKYDADVSKLSIEHQHSGFVSLHTKKLKPKLQPSVTDSLNSLSLMLHLFKKEKEGYVLEYDSFCILYQAEEPL